MAVLVTGAAGFIGYHTAERLLAEGRTVVGVDSLNEYYDVTLKHARLARLQARPGFSFVKLDLADREGASKLFADVRPEVVVHLAAQAGVRYSLTAPHAYIDSNITAFLHVLEACRALGVGHLLYASSSSVYGVETGMPFSEAAPVGHPASLYAATKRADELMAHAYSHLFGVPTTGLRFFTVYGPWGRPDMALFLFTQAILEGRPIELFNHGDMARDFTYVDDIVDGIVGLVDRAPSADLHWDPVAADPGTSAAPWRVYNIGNGAPVQLADFVSILESVLGRTAERRYVALQAGDVPRTHADVTRLRDAIGYRSRVPVTVGVQRFVEWYRMYYEI